MVRYAQTVLLRDDPEAIRKYEEFHAHPWPEIAMSWKAQGVERAFIFKFGRQLFMIVEANDNYNPQGNLSLPAAVQERLAEWGKMMTNDFQEALPGTSPQGGKWVRMEEIYTFEAKK